MEFLRIEKRPGFESPSLECLQWHHLFCAARGLENTDLKPDITFWVQDKDNLDYAEHDPTYICPKWQVSTDNHNNILKTYKTRSQVQFCTSDYLLVGTS